MTYAIQFDEVTKRYHKGEYGYGSLRDALLQLLDGRKGSRQGTVALSNVSFEVAEGDLLGLIGPNGSGKTTILRLIYRLTSPTSGTIRIRGRVGALIEIGSGLHPELTGRENIFFHGRLIGMSRQEVMGCFEQIVDFAEIGPVLDIPLKRYSAGMSVRLSFAIVSHLNPDVFLVDETLSVGDEAFQRKCTGRIRELIRRGSTVILVSHHLQLIRDVCTKVAFLLNGKIQHLDDPESSIRIYLDWVQSRNGGSSKVTNEVPLELA